VKYDKPSQEIAKRIERILPQKLRDKCLRHFADLIRRADESSASGLWHTRLDEEEDRIKFVAGGRLIFAVANDEAVIYFDPEEISQKKLSQARKLQIPEPPLYQLALQPKPSEGLRFRGKDIPKALNYLKKAQLSLVKSAIDDPRARGLEIGQHAGHSDEFIEYLREHVDKSLPQPGNLGTLTGKGVEPDEYTRKGATPPTKEQQERGLRGENEVLRRLKRRSGLNGWKFREDRRNTSCGYDFLCRNGNKDVELEVKTFQLGGQLFFPENEFRIAKSSGQSYYLLGMIDDGGSPKKWPYRVLNSPCSELLRVGKKQTSWQFRVNAASLKWDKEP
jgi:Domain of unknown function (DUF3883)